MLTGFFSDILQILQNPYICLIIFTALAFDFVNGFHDSANSVATIVGTRVLRPGYAVLWAAWWNFAAAWFFGVHVANTVAKWVRVDFVTPDVIFAGLLGAILWNLITWYFGLPTSSSHALLGGFAGAAVTYAFKWEGVLNVASLVKTVAFIFVAPVFGLLLGMFILTGVLWLIHKIPSPTVDRYSRIIQLGSAAAYSLGHGTNDAQKTMGIIAALLFASVWKGQQQAYVSGQLEFPFWIVLLCHLVMGLGTVFGGWKIIKTMGMKLAKLRPYQGACAEAAGAITLFATAKLGIPVSTTHTITGSIAGVGSVQRFKAVDWGLASKIVWAWIFTIPAAALIAGSCYGLILLARAITS